ncbi:MAG: aldo/keto reductase [Anaerolineae bacterium]|nr:aldo/keto reductase [Anaerolineae bacterium]
MEYRNLGRTGIKISALGFGCGAVGGLLIKGAHKDKVAVVARAIESGITYFDTARAYGDGQSEASLGRVLEELNADVIIGTKVNLLPEEMADIRTSIFASVEGSLRRLRREQVELIQLHNVVRQERQPERGWVSLADVEAALDAFETLKQQGKVRHYGINGLGDTGVLHEAIALGRAETVQSCYNLLNPTAGMPAARAFPFQDYEQLIDKAAAQGIGVIAIRVLAAGALSGTPDRAANAAPRVTPIGTAATYAKDVALAQRFDFLAEEGYVKSLVEAAVRFVLAKPEVSTAMVGISNMDQLDKAVTYANRGPLPAEAMARLDEVWSGFANTEERDL